MSYYVSSYIVNLSGDMLTHKTAWNVLWFVNSWSINNPEALFSNVNQYAVLILLFNQTTNMTFFAKKVREAKTATLALFRFLHDLL